MDLSRTVGWFTSSYPIFIPFIQTDIERQIKDVKRNLKSCAAKGNRLWLASIHDSISFTQKAAPQMSFNYLGQLDQIDGEAYLYLADERNGLVHDPKSRKTAFDRCMDNVERSASDEFYDPS